MKRSLIVLALLSAFMALPGCGGGLTVTQYTAYNQEEQRCEANEDAIVARTPSTEEADRADLTAEHARCSAALRTILGLPALDAGVPQ